MSNEKNGLQELVAIAEFMYKGVVQSRQPMIDAYPNNKKVRRLVRESLVMGFYFLQTSYAAAALYFDREEKRKEDAVKILKAVIKNISEYKLGVNKLLLQEIEQALIAVEKCETPKLISYSGSLGHQALLSKRNCESVLEQLSKISKASRRDRK